MAKWGEGDPRWIVEERADATNVNNWHWTEKNATPWSKDKLKELLVGFQIENDEFKVQIKDLTKLDGEATANNRKSKLIFFYEWVINGDWEGTVKNSENKTVYKGTFEVPNLSEENDVKDVDVSVSLKDNYKNEKLKEFMRKEGANKIREQFSKYIQSLRQEFSQGLILPTGKDAKPKVNTTTTPPPTKPLATVKQIVETSSVSSSNGLGAKIETKNLTMTEEFKCRVNELYNVFTNISLVKAFTQNTSLVYEPEKGGKFSLFDNNIQGTFISLVKNKRITMNWRNKRWPEGYFSLVLLDFEEKEDHTLLKLTQTGIPQNFYENTEDGWRNFYWNAIRQTFGYGSRIF